jgi:hypothetical protein
LRDRPIDQALALAGIYSKLGIWTGTLPSPRRKQDVPMVQSAARFAFERAVLEYGRWCAVEEEARSPAAAWWWSPALAVSREQETLPVDWADMLALPSGASYADGARVMLAALAEQTALPWPDEFPRCYHVRQSEQSSA